MTMALELNKIPISAHLHVIYTKKHEDDDEVVDDAELEVIRLVLGTFF